jgi:hypothetical protein
LGLGLGLVVVLVFGVSHSVMSLMTSHGMFFWWRSPIVFWWGLCRLLKMSEKKYLTIGAKKGA